MNNFVFNENEVGSEFFAIALASRRPPRFREFKCL